VDTVAFEASTAGFATTGSSQPQARVLVGQVTDAVYGDVTAIGYMDAVRPATLPGGFDDSTVTFVQFELVRSYVYGDTTAVLPLELRQVDGSWTPTGLPTDTTLGTGDLITTASMTASDTLLTIPLPASWVAANGDQFTSGEFLSTFEGFALRVAEGAGPQPGAVVGFDVSSASSRIRVGTRSDTLSFLLSEVYTELQRAARPPSPAGLLALRADAPIGAKLQFGFDAVGTIPLARAVLRLPLDRSLSGTTGTFVRPLAQRMAIYAIRPEQSDALLGEATVPTTGDARSAASSVITSLVQDLLLGSAEVTRFEVRLPVSPVSLDVLPLVLPGLPDQPRPRFNLTVVGQPL
jgi:hypothetical protein